MAVLNPEADNLFIHLSEYRKITLLKRIWLTHFSYGLVVTVNHHYIFLLSSFYKDFLKPNSRQGLVLWISQGEKICKVHKGLSFAFF